MIPPVTLQPFVENAIRYGLKNNPRPNQLTIEATKEQEEILITISDNGIGRKQNQSHKPNNRGIDITRKRIYNFSKAEIALD